MRTTFLVAVIAAGLSSAAIAQSLGEKTGVNPLLGITPKTEDFIKEAAISDMLEIAAAKIAQEKGNADEKKFAEQMIRDHGETNSELKQLVPPGFKSALPTSLDGDSQKDLDKLRDAKAEDFANDYDQMQVDAHQGAVLLFERYAKGGDDPRLKDWAGKTLPKLQHHLQMAQQLEKSHK